jgi:hypothetical protein
MKKKKLKSSAKTKEIGEDEVASANEMTGLIGPAPATQTEKDAYEEIIRYTPRSSGGAPRGHDV